ncbi:MAG: hypothetical protein EXS63_03525 [Candidatus Omnitrophica bacterium]|nr:hypothetical protein [Candidatus Omnitrophota bacterium]
MAENKVSINFGGRQVQATPVEITQNAERWNEYLLEDGTVLKMKLVLKKVLRVDGEFDAEGNPIYIMQSTNVSSTSSPDGLRKKTE